MKVPVFGRGFAEAAGKEIPIGTRLPHYGRRRFAGYLAGSHEKLTSDSLVGSGIQPIHLARS
jgi:hypothetical protein